MSNPPLTPFEAMSAHREVNNADFEKDGWHFSLDGPQGCPVEVMASVAYLIGDKNVQFFISGEECEPITEAHTWYRFQL